MTPEQYRLTVDAITHIDRAIAMLKDLPEIKNSPYTAGYNGVVSLLRYAKESHEHQISELENRLKEVSVIAVDLAGK